jgi:outer membrane protein TolC
MRRHLAAYAAAIACAPVLASSPDVGDWREANEQVSKAGGWKAYSRESALNSQEKSPAPRAPLAIDPAVSRAMALEPSLSQTLTGVVRDPARYPFIGEHQRAVLTIEAQIVADVSLLYLAAVAARERVAYREQVAETASIAAELASRMRRVGNLNALHQTEHELDFAETEKNLSHARVNAMRTREALLRRLQWSDMQLRDLPSRLPDLPSALPPLQAVDARLLEIPLANPESVRLQSELRQAILVRDEAYGLARHYRDHVLPLQRRISQEHLLHYNGMIIGVFELLKDAKSQIHSVEAYLDALHAFWQAEIALQPRLHGFREHLVMFRRDAWK